MAPANPLPYEYTLRQPDIELTVRTKTATQLSKAHNEAKRLMRRMHSSWEEEPYLRYHLPNFLVHNKLFLKRMARYERKYPDLKTIDFSVPLVANVRIDASEAGISFSLSEEQAAKARTRITASMPEHTCEVLIATYGNVPEDEARRISNLRSPTRVGFEHRHSDLDDFLRVVVFCFTPTEAVPYE